MIPSKSFHRIRDNEIRRTQFFNGTDWVPAKTEIDLNLTYQFFAHFHPYVPHLIQNLNNGGIAGLQASDTIYAPDTPTNPKSGAPLQVQQDSTRAILIAEVAATLENGTTVNLGAGSSLTLADSTLLTLPNPTPVVYPDGSTGTLTDAPQVSLPGQIPISTPSGILWSIGGKETVIPDGTIVILQGTPKAVLSNDGTPVTLPANSQVSIRSGIPTAYFFENIFNPASYDPDSTTVPPPWPVKSLDFTLQGAYSIYNWEIFFHVPLMIAVHLSQNQKFQDAQEWFHYIFNPTDNSDGPTPQRFWKVQPFQYTDAETIENILVNLSVKADPQLYDQTIKSIDQWKIHPFQPWAIAQFRPTANMLKTVMAYLDNLIAWGDSLFRQYTIETLNEATQIYVLAANILGPKPQAVPNQGAVKPITYGQVRGKLDAFGDTLAEIETDIPFDSAPLPGLPTNPAGAQILPSIGHTLYFCIPQNDQLMGYWDTVANRLFNIHNSLNLQGVYQQLPLYDPPIDPALLVRAAAEGLDVSAIVSGLNQPLPLVRFRLLISQAVEICQEVKSLGSGMLSAMEKGDNEAMALLRAQHESSILNLAQMVKYSQWQDATKAKQALEQTFNNTVERFTYYQQLLGQKAADVSKSIPQLTDLDTPGLQSFAFSQAGETGEPQLKFDAINVDISSGVVAAVSDGGVQTLSSHETEELGLITAAEVANGVASGLGAVSAILGAIPQFDANGEFMGVGITVSEGGQQFSALMNGLAAAARGTAEVLNTEGTKAAKLGSYERRQQEWLNQSNLAKGEINQIFKQWRGAQIREAIAAQEYQNHLKQIEQAQDIESFLEGQALSGFPVKETTVDFYSWMKRETKELLSKAFQLAYDIGKKAERALQNELGDPTRNYIQYGYLDGTEGLLAGERLMFDLKTMEMAYHDLNQREYELTKHVSLLQVAPLALMQLRATGTCLVTLPEELFDLDGPGHYFRRVKSVALSIPCVTGPYTSVNCTLSLQKSSIRTNTSLVGGRNGYARTGANDERFNDYFGALQTIVTSTALSDSGLFETNLNDERYLPFEAVGVAGSQWQLTLPSDVPQFDHDTITDVVLHIRYTAREGGSSLQSAALSNLKDKIAKGQTVGSARLFSLRHDFPTDWARFKSAATGSIAQLSFSLTTQQFPFWASQLKSPMGLQAIQFMAELGSNERVNMYSNALAAPASSVGLLTLDPSLGLLTGSLPKTALPSLTEPSVTPAPAPYNLYFDNNEMTDLWMLATWTGSLN